ncbi:MAG TPA: Hpt domain-containing protein [Bacteroidales bacterium]|nr:Hpt domain-containing protein [Bacteroidales bacterium]
MSENNSPGPYDLTRLYEYVGSEPEVVKEMVELFIQSATDSLANMETCLLKADCKNLSKESHKIKSSLQIFGFVDQLETIHKFEQATDALPHDAATRFDALKNRLLSGIAALRQDFGIQ